MEMIEQRTIQDFGEQWNNFTDNEGYYGSKELFWDLFGKLIKKHEIVDKSVVEIGSGTGRIVNMLLDVGAKYVTAIEPSDAFDVLIKNIKKADKDRVKCLKVTGDELEATGDVDFVFSVVALVVLLPLMILIYLFIVFESKGGGFYNQRRVGMNGAIFHLHKFRTMYTGSDRAGLITVGKRDSRITRTGNFLRKTKLDELPQLINILKGEMSVVGPRPEVEKYVQMYDEEQRKILKVRPGLADITSIRFANEAEILGEQSDPEDYYIRVLMPQKLKMSLDNAQNPSLKKYFEIIGLTIKLILKAR